LDALRLSFSEQSLELSYKAFLSVLSEDQRWLLHDGTDHYMIIKDVDAGKLDVFKELLPIRSGDELVRYNPTAGMFDVSYSAAWELGRLLTLQNKRVSVDLFNWKRSHAQSLKDAERQMDHLPFDIPTALDLPDSVRTWFTDLALLKDLPFNYLVPDERMLPTESIRFFQVDSSWVECLLDGAFSIGRVLSTDHEREGNLNVHPREEKKISGFLLRSDLVAGWPGLLVDGYSDGEANNPLALLRMDRRSKNVLLCLFEGLIQAVDIHLKPETLHFGVTPNDNDTGYIKELKTQDASTVDITWKQLSNEDTKQQEEAAKKRVVDIASLVSSLEKELPKEAEEKEAMNSAQFALQMIEGVEKVRFMISK